AGDVVKVGQVIGQLVGAGEAPLTPQPPLPRGERGSQNPEVATQTLLPPPSPLVGEGGRGGEGKASPRARRAARELGLDWRAIPGSGRNGRVRERDVRQATESTEGRLVPHTKLRKVIAARMVAGVTQAAPVTLTTRADVSDLVALRAASADAPSYLAFLIR